jgi:hypothetical protein
MAIAELPTGGGIIGAIVVLTDKTLGCDRVVLPTEPVAIAQIGTLSAVPIALIRSHAFGCPYNRWVFDDMRDIRKFAILAVLNVYVHRLAYEPL